MLTRQCLKINGALICLVFEPKEEEKELGFRCCGSIPLPSHTIMHF